MKNVSSFGYDTLILWVVAGTGLISFLFLIGAIVSFQKHVFKWQVVIRYNETGEEKSLLSNENLYLTKEEAEAKRLEIEAQFKQSSV